MRAQRVIGPRLEAGRGGADKVDEVIAIGCASRKKPGGRRFPEIQSAACKKYSHSFSLAFSTGNKHLTVTSAGQTLRGFSPFLAQYLCHGLVLGVRTNFSVAGRRYPCSVSSGR